MNEQDKNTNLLEERALQLWDQAALRQEMAEWKKEKTDFHKKPVIFLLQCN